VIGNGASHESNGHRHDLEEAVTGVGVSPVFQPIVSLPAGTPVGFEALARWPNQPHLGPQSVFAHAAATDRVSQLDRLCIDRAVDTALRGGLNEGALLGVNSEPASVYTGRADSEVLERGHGKFELLFELTERNLLEHLPTLLRKVDALRADGIAIALDDVGTNPDSLALLDVVSPEVIKLATTLVQGVPDAETARTGAAIMAHRERRGTLIIAEGIETDRHLERALSLGASLGQGFLFGRPGPLPSHTRTAKWSPPAEPGCARSVFVSPFDVVAADPSIRSARREALAAIARHLEEEALRARDTPMVLTAIQHNRHFGRDTRDRYAALAKVCPLVAVAGQDLTTELPPNVRGVTLDAADPLCAQWVVVTLGPHTAVAMIAHERSPLDAVEEDRRFDFVVTHDRTSVTAAASALLKRVP
jgi:EAL domain-containing protein (putative c-di-GMP-specific phosphodiesterase class I)